MSDRGADTAMEACRILVLDDRPEDVELAARELRSWSRPFGLLRVDTRRDFRAALEEYDPDVILCDYSVPGFDGIEALGLAKEGYPGTPVIMYTGTLTEETAIQCLRRGADDYILKDNPARLLPAVEAALRARRDREEKARAEASLRESEERFRGLVETAHDAIVSFDSTGKIRFLNSAGEAIFGYPRSDLEGECLDLLFTDSVADVLSGAVSDDAGPSAGEDLDGLVPRILEGRRRDGSRFPAEVTVSGWGSGGGAELHAIVRDISDRVQAQKALEELSRQHELILSSAGEGILRMEGDGTVSYANPVALAMLDLEAEDLLGRDPHPIIHEPGKDSQGRETDCPVHRAIREGIRFRGELVFHRKDGSPFPVAASCTPVLDRERSGGAVMIFEDITVRTRQDRALRASEARYRALFEHAPHGIYQSSMDGRFLSVNPALVEMLGYGTEEDALAVDLERDLYQDPEERRRLIQQFHEADRILGVESQWRRADGRSLRVRLSGRTLRTGDGGLEGYEMFVEDLTERRELEEQLRHAQKMEAVGQLTGGIAHDFNNVLSVILLNAELMEVNLQAGEEIDPADIRVIHDAAKRASSITRKLLGFSRRAELLMEPACLGTVVQNLTGMLRTLLPENIELVVEDRGDSEMALIDTGSVEQMVLNLVSNSRDALPSGGRVAVTVEREDLESGDQSLGPDLPPGSYLCVEVEDDGSGMDPEVLQRVFDPFFTTKAPEAGTGLGMAMVYGLAKQQGGHVTIRSELGEGTTTRIIFPVYEVVDEEAAPEAGVTEKPEIPATILLVEDDETLQRATARALERRGFKVFPVDRAEEALEILAERPDEVDLVLSDLVLPGMGGMELFEEIRASQEDLPFVLTSGYSSTGKVAAARNVDPSIPFVRKPSVLDDLLGVIRSALRGA